jgi:hypothetical protein
LALEGPLGNDTGDHEEPAVVVRAISPVSPTAKHVVDEALG